MGHQPRPGIAVAFDASALAKRERTGIARYGVCLVDALLAAGGVSRCVLGYRASRWRRRAHVYHPGGAAVRWFVDAAPRVTLGAYDVFHGLDARLPRGGGGARVATLHDVEQLARPEIAAEGFRRRKQDHLQRVADRADRVICVSAASRDAFAARFHVEPARLRVVHHGIDPRFSDPGERAVSAALDRVGVRPPYLLFVGLLAARKNLVALIDAFDRAVPDLPDGTRLVLAGGTGHGFASIDAAIRRAAHRDLVVRPGFVDDADLPGLYAGAAAFAFPGLAEGFGMPMLEAMACGTPVVAADVPVSREVAGDAALLVDASDPDRLAEGLVAAATPGPAREERRLLGRRRATEFSWSAAAARTVEVYREALERPVRSKE